MSKGYEKLVRLLKELFQLDQADLDFGIYRIMNQKHDEITGFLETDLLPQVKKAFEDYESQDKVLIEDELEEIVQKLKGMGADPESADKVKELRAKLSGSVDIVKLENEVYSDLYTFFRRYYHEGDFISQRRYKNDVYAIPYQGEEVKLHWANHDQYYIKTSEYFRDYTFKLHDGRRVHFKLVDADTEKDNLKTESGKDRRFILKAEDQVEELDGELYIYFEYREDSSSKKQDTFNEEARDTVLSESSISDWHLGLAKPEPTDANPKRTFLDKHLAEYTAKNTFDFFIHKDLGGFLRRELDFYIKNEVMHLDDIENDSAPRVEQYLSKVKALRKIAHKVIDFLAQIEDFQKKLWLKKKFVVETNYCITLDRVPEELYPEICANVEQREEWVSLFAVNEIVRDLNTPAYSTPLTVEFLHANPYLVLDTRHFDSGFQNQLIAQIEDINNRLNGLIIHGDNFQSLNLLCNKFLGNIDCVYIDPPYNTGTGDFLYKDNYQHSSWLSMIEALLTITRSALNDKGHIFISIDDNEVTNLRHLLEAVFHDKDLTGEFVWKKRSGGDMSAGRGLGIANEHEYVLTAANSSHAKYSGLDIDRSDFKNPDNDPDGPWKTEDLTCNKTSIERPNLFYDLVDPETDRVFKCNPKRVWAYEKSKMEKYLSRTVEGRKLPKVIFPENDNGRPQLKKFISDRKSYKKPISSWLDTNSSPVTEDGDSESKIAVAPLNSKATRDLQNILGFVPFCFPKAFQLVQIFVEQGTETSGVVLDYFAGTGTTAHAVIEQNRHDGGLRKYILIENANYIHDFLIPRIKKVVYSDSWQEGKPVSREGSSHMFKYIKLESYEDTLNNLELKRTDDQNKLLSAKADLKESYMLSYMLDVESKNSQSLLNVEQFDDPFNYKLNIATGSAGETKPTNVDLVETFNYLIGLTVKHIDFIRGVKVIEGTNPQGNKVLILWRNVKEMDNTKLDEWFKKQGYSTRDFEFDLIYVNGDNNLENLRHEEDTWKVRMIELEFKRLMFDVEDV